MARLHWLEAMLPLGIIGGMLCIMGNAQYYIHRAAHGRVRSSRLRSYPSGSPCWRPLSLCVVWVQPKHIGNDMWDVAMERRDKKLVEQAPGN
jgi:NADH dehydrogenase (ubiquinone) 1 alpha subcomplex subunit 1